MNLKSFLSGSTAGSSDRSAASDNVTWYGVNKTIFIRLVLSGILFFAGLLIPRNQWTVFLYLLSFLICGYDLIYIAFRDLTTTHRMGEELLLVIVSVLSFTINAAYEAAAVVIIYQIGILLRAYSEAVVKGDLYDKVDLIAPTTTLQQGNGSVKVSSDQVQMGDVLLLQPDDRSPVDGRVLDGDSLVDFSALTGREKKEQLKRGDIFPAGARCISSSLRIISSGTIDESIWARSLRLLSVGSEGDEGELSGMDRYARIFAPFATLVTILLTLLILIFTNASLDSAIHRALILLIVACPLSLLCPVPLLYLAGLVRSLRKGVLVKGKDVLDSLSRVASVVLDKDDMLTEGEYRVQSVHSEKLDPATLIRVAAHIASAAPSELFAPIEKSYNGIIDPALVNVVGRFDDGVIADIEGIRVAMGSRKFLSECGLDLSRENVPEGYKNVFLSFGGQYAGTVVLVDVLRTDAVPSVMSIESTGCDCVMLSPGDPETSKLVADALGVQEFYSDCMPLDRLEKIQKIKERFPVNTVLYVGNGKNDSSELSAADVSVCVNGLSSEIAFQSGDVIVMDDSPGPLADAIDSARIAKRTIRSCLLMTLTAKAALLFLAVVGWEYQLWFAMLVEVLAGTIGILRASRAGKSDL